MPFCYFLVGPMGSGKSTWIARNREALNDPAIVSTDDLFEAVAARDGITYGEAFARYSYLDMIKDARAHLIRAVIAKRDIVIDQTNCTVEDRRVFRAHIPDRYTTVGVEFEFDKETCINRVIERARLTGKEVPIWAVVNKIKNYVPCQPGEFDEVRRISRTGE